MSWFNKCNHDWVVLVDKFIPSNVERVAGTSSGAQEFRYVATDMEATNIIILKCTKCNKLDKTITKT